MLKYWICFCLLPLSVFAHPHVWVQTTLEMLTKEGQMTGFRVLWSFDEMFSASFLHEADSNKNKKLDESEADETVQQVFVDDEQQLHPFMHTVPSGQKITFKLKNPRIWMKDDYLQYQFDILFDEPQSITGKHEFGIYDPEFYVAFEQDLEIKLPEGVSCQQDLAENENISIYYGVVNPETYTLTCS